MGMAWSDLEDPTAAELLAVAPGLDLDAVEILTSTAVAGHEVRPVLERHGDAVVALLLFPAHVPGDHRFAYLELGIVATAESIVTVRKHSADGYVVEQRAVAPVEHSRVEPGRLLHGAVDEATERYLDVVDALYVEIDDLEDAIDELPGDMTRRRLGELRHEMLHARRNVTAMRAAVRRVVDGRLALPDDILFPREVEAAFADSYDTLVRTTEELDIARDLLASVRDHLQAKVSERQNEIVKKLTVTASLVLVPTLITGFYGQNFAGAFDSALWTVGVSLGLIATTTLAQLAFFRWKRWI
jgi:magnesium transporter